MGSTCKSATLTAEAASISAKLFVLTDSLLPARALGEVSFNAVAEEGVVLPEMKISSRCGSCVCACARVCVFGVVRDQESLRKQAAGG